MPLTHPDPPLADCDLLLRPPRPSDLAALTAACADADLAAWVWPPAGSSAESGARLVEDLTAGWRERTAALVAVEGGALVGIVSVMVDDDPAVAELGIWVAPAARRGGRATRITRLVARWAHETLGVVRLWLEVDPGNKASHRVAVRLGFRREGLLRSHCFDRQTGGRRDCVIYSLLPGDAA